jgi:hypothetical protein
MIFDSYIVSFLKLEKIKHGFKTLAECGGIRGVDDTSSLKFLLQTNSNRIGTSHPKGKGISNLIK